MLPIKLLKDSRSSQVLVELKSGDSATGILHSVDSFMNLKLKKVTYIERIGPKFITVDEIFIRGSTINSLQLREDIIDKVKELEQAQKNMYSNKNEDIKEINDNPSMKPRRFYNKEIEKNKSNYQSNREKDKSIIRGQRGGIKRGGRGS